MFMGREKEEQGKVYVYCLNQVTVTLVEIQENLFLKISVNNVLIFHSLWQKEQRSFQGQSTSLTPQPLNEHLEL